ncbi:MAG: type II toxin-antitoxin system VapC family toxin [Akkermansiaceae bacterium]
MRYCLDTHTVIWAVKDDPRLGRNARKVISSSNREDLLLPSLVLLEISMLLSKGRLEIHGSPASFLKSVAGLFHQAELSPEIVHQAMKLELPHGDPFDRVIAATAMVNRAALLTRDSHLANCQSIETVWD